jgi:hypothetical protein
MRNVAIRPNRSIPAGRPAPANAAGHCPKDVIEALRRVREFLGQFNSAQPDSEEPHLPETASLSSDTTFTQAATSGRRTTSVCGRGRSACKRQRRLMNREFCASQLRDGKLRSLRLKKHGAILIVIKRTGPLWLMCSDC